jgi:hypothetical protein
VQHAVADQCLPEKSAMNDRLSIRDSYQLIEVHGVVAPVRLSRDCPDFSLRKHAAACFPSAIG